MIGNMDVFQVQVENNSEIEELQANTLSNNMAEISEDEDLCGNVVIFIENMLQKLPPINKNSSIYRVSKQLREMNPKAYTPQVISIGPLHHHKSEMGDFGATEQYKLQALINFLRRMNNNKIKSLMEIKSLEDLLKTGSLKVVVKKANSWMKEARNCYVETIYMDNDKFVIMMLKDACFIVEFLILEFEKKLITIGLEFDQIQENIDLSLLYQEIRLDIISDLVKLENQVPFFLLQNLFDLLPGDSVPTSLIDLIESFARSNWSLASRYKYFPLRYINIKPKHLVDFFSFYFDPLPLVDLQKKQHKVENMNKFLNFFRVRLCSLWQKPDEKKREVVEWVIPPSITELCEAGVTIRKAKDAEYVMDISFKNGVLEIPSLHIYDEFELELRNVLAFEQFQPNKCALSYVSFLDNLISTEKDVSLLVKAGVIINRIGGSDKEVSDIFNNLCKFVTSASYSGHFRHINKALCEHYNGKWNKAKASLKHNYFNTPWAFISFFAATFLIFLTLLQTIFSAISAFPT